MKGISEFEKSKIKSAFGKLNQGDLITLAKVAKESLVVIRHIKDRAVIGVICDCGKRHVNKVIDDTYIWSDEMWAIVGSDGSVPVWWSADLQMERGAALSVAMKSLQIPVSADYSSYSRADFIDGHIDEMRKGIDVIIASSAPEASLRRVMEMAGVTVNDEQARLIYLTLLKASKISSVGILEELIATVATCTDMAKGKENITLH